MFSVRLGLLVEKEEPEREYVHYLAFYSIRKWFKKIAIDWQTFRVYCKEEECVCVLETILTTLSPIRD